MISCKSGVKINGIKPEINFCLVIVESIYKNYGYKTIVTSVVDGKHGYSSLHYPGFAIDFRIRHLPEGLPEIIKSDIKAALTDEFDVILESTHIHIEFQPKRP